MKKTTTTSTALTTRTLLFSLLRKLNLSYDIDENQDIVFTYQGERIEITANDERKYILIMDLWWYYAPLDDIENLAIFHRAVNECNYYNSANTLTYYQDNDDSTINLHTFRALYLTPEIPEIDAYFKAALDSMMYMHHLFFNTMEDIRREKHLESV
ncbi:MAG: hypothetical protein J6U22_03535 [Bacteroidaceae bacterium]|nr:hypothetical protein [Bacteroidaceae bacterium]